MLDIAPDSKADGYGVPIGEFTATDALLLFFMVLGFASFIYLLIKFGLFLAKKYVFIEKRKITKNNKQLVWKSELLAEKTELL